MTIQQHWPFPSRPRPVVVLGAGAIVRDAHLPAYRLMHVQVDGLFDLDRTRAEELARQFHVKAVHSDLEEAVKLHGANAMYDIALPPLALLPTLEEIPEGAAVLIQKPMGIDLAEATEIRDMCHARKLRAAVNFQLRYAPVMLAIRDILRRGLLGQIVDIEVRVTSLMPWKEFPFAPGLQRLEIPMHSIHYLDAMRALFGEPRGISATTLAHPQAKGLANTRSAMIVDYGPGVLCTIRTHHHHRWGARFGASEIRIDGTEGSVVGRLGVNFDYPRGVPDGLWLVHGNGQEWEEVALEGSWYPHAFRGPPSNLLRFMSGEDQSLWTGIDDAWKTMALVEACYTKEAALRGHACPDPHAAHPIPAH